MTNEKLIGNPSECINTFLRDGRTCTECYFSQIHDGKWTGTEACWNAQCIESEQAMNATEKLRHMLDERGVKWQDGGEGLTIIPIQDSTSVAWEINTWPSSKDTDDCLWVQNRHPLTPEQAIAATLGGDGSDTVKRLMKLQGGHYSWPRLYEAVTGDPFDYECPPSKSEEVFIEKLISIVGGRKVVNK